MWINISLAAFNLLPAFPRDGGRVLRAILAFRLGVERSTRIASRVGLVLAAVFVGAGLLFNPMLALIGVFVWFAARQEAAVIELRALLSGVRVRDTMITSPATVDADASIERTAVQLLTSGHPQLVVVDHGRLAGVVTAPDLVVMAPPRSRALDAVGGAEIPMIGPDDQVEDVLPRIERSGAAYVVDGGELVGLLTLGQLATYAALHGPSANRHVGPSRQLPRARSSAASARPATGN